MKIIDKVALIHIEDYKVLSTLSKGKDKFYFPGGKRDGSETDLQTLVREIKEELSVDIIEDSVKPYGIFEAHAHGKAEDILVRMTCLTADYTGQLKADNEIEKFEWLTYQDKENSSEVDQLIFKDLLSKGLIK